MKSIDIVIPTKQIHKLMLDEEWITVDAIENHRISIELILMFQHGVVALNQPAIYYDDLLFEKITIAGQIEANKLAIYNCFLDGQYKNCFSESIAIMHQKQLNILQNLKNLMITQYN